jgi:RNA polymerase sigma factor (sigma-70 family)
MRGREERVLPGGMRQPEMESQFSGAIAAARSGSGRAFAWLYSEFSPRILAFFRAQRVSEPDELTNDVFAAAFRSLDRFDGDDAAFWSWLFTIARNKLVDEHRKSARRVTTVAADPTTGYDDRVGGDVETEAMDILGRKWVHDTLAQLVPDQRDVLVLRLVGDLTIDQIAEVLGKQSGAVKALQRRGLAALRKIVAEHGVTLTGHGDV